MMTFLKTITHCLCSLVELRHNYFFFLLVLQKHRNPCILPPDFSTTTGDMLQVHKHGGWGYMQSTGCPPLFYQEIKLALEDCPTPRSPINKILFINSSVHEVFSCFCLH